MRPVKGRVILLASTILLSLIFFLPSTPLYSYIPEWGRKYLPGKEITLGLDLQGGMHLVLQVEGEKAIEGLVDRMSKRLEELVEEKGIEVVSIRRTELAGVTITYTGTDTFDKLTRLVDDHFPDLVQKEKKEGEVLFGLPEGQMQRVKENAASQVLETIRNRIDQFGVAEPLLQRQGPDQIVIQLPGIRDPQRALNLIGKTALLEFKLVDEESPITQELPLRVPPGAEEQILKEYEGKIPEEDEILFERIVSKETGRVSKRPFLVKKKAALTGDMLTDARVGFGEFNEPYVTLRFDKTGTRIFDTITGENINKRLAIILDNVVYSAPVIRTRIDSGRAQIEGGFTTQEASDLAAVLRAGALPAPVRTIQNLTVGPTLGRDSIEKGILSGSMGAVLVLFFMAFYYRLAGLVANFALLLNVLLLVGALASLNATLTLPGIAGIILTIGMSVDANVLIYERIREELRMGKPVRLAVDSGYEKAWATILDSNVTTLITAAALFLVGTGPVKGFAVTLFLGVAINLFTAVVGTKVVFDYMNARKKLTRLSI